MIDFQTRWTRRRFFSNAGLASLAGAVLPPWAVVGLADRLAEHRVRRAQRRIHEQLGIRPIINASAPLTTIGGTIMHPEVVAAMDEASRHYLSLDELHEAVGRRIASLVGAEAALVTAGCGAAMTQGTAACVAGNDPDRIRRIPDTRGMKNEVIIQRAHRISHDHAVRNVGVTLVEVETREDLERAINDRTAMVFFLNWADPLGSIGREEFLRVARAAGVPAMIDAAGDLPPNGRLNAYLEMGYDLVCFSGGKGLRGPQCSGLLLGRKDLVDAAYSNGSPHNNSVSRVSKVGKEEIVGLWTAVERYVARDHEAEWAEWERQLDYIDRAISAVPGVRTERFMPTITNEVPHLLITWDVERLGFTRTDFVRALDEGDPRIHVRNHDVDEEGRHVGYCPVIGEWPEISTWCLQPGEYRIVAERCVDVVRRLSGA
jgi:L-seryl-tRNA(Ser) seleniumtransferase